MRCLKIPNTKHFHDITTIADAQALYGRIKDTLKQVCGRGGLGLFVCFVWCGREATAGSDLVGVRDAIHPPQHY